MAKKIYIAATSQHVGKTTTTLGIMAALQKRNLNVGYCKPVGQEFVDLGDLKVDKDALLFSTILDFDLQEKLHSPVILGKGATAAYLENPDSSKHNERLMDSLQQLENLHEYLVFEGTGHPGVGSVVDLSNADVADMIDAGVIMIVEGGIGNTIDKLNSHLALFREKKVPILGVIINKVLESKIEKVKKYVGLKLKTMGIPLLGLIPYDETLSYPILETIRHAVHGTFILGREKLDNKVRNVVSGALLARKEYDSLKNLLLVVNHQRLDKAVNAAMDLMKRKNLDTPPLSGVLVHGEPGFEEDIWNECNCKEILEKYEIPLISTTLDTYGSAVKISSLEVKINTRTPWKALKAIDLVNEHVDIDKIIKSMS